MSTRKKWRLKLIPLFTYQPMPSMKRTYEAVEHYRTAYASSGSRIHHVNVEIDEGNGWQLYERIIFPPRQGEKA